MLEKDLWDTVRRGVGSHWRVQRIEDSLSADIPDVFFSVKHGTSRVGGLVELKCQEPTRGGKITARHYTQGQRDFAQIHAGTVFLLLHSNGWFMLFDHTKADEILRGQTVEWHVNIALWATRTPDWPKLVDILRLRLCQQAVDQ